jgi:aminodeoxyfutalosine deaminase
MTIEMTETQDLAAKIAKLPKAELHLHLEGSITPETVSLLGERRGIQISPESARARYEYSDFLGFLDAFKWAVGYLKDPEDYALVTHRLADELVRQNVIYAEVTISAGVMIRFGQNVEANFAAIHDVGLRYREKGLRLAWIFDATRQFGGEAAVKVATLAAKLQRNDVLALGLGGDELSVKTANFRAAYDLAKSHGLHVVAHAGEIGGPEMIRDAVEMLGAERIGHGIAAIRDLRYADQLATLRIPLEICPTSNIRTGALARQLDKPTAVMAEHPLAKIVERGVTVVLSTDDPAMFHTDLLTEYGHAIELGLSESQIVRMIEAGFSQGFLPPAEKRPLIEQFRASARALGML